MPTFKGKEKRSFLQKSLLGGQRIVMEIMKEGAVNVLSNGER